MCLRLSQFSQLPFIQDMGPCIFSLPNHPGMVVRVCTLYHHYHHQIGNTIYNKHCKLKSMAVNLTDTLDFITNIWNGLDTKIRFQSYFVCEHWVKMNALLSNVTSFCFIARQGNIIYVCVTNSEYIQNGVLHSVFVICILSWYGRQGVYFISSLSLSNRKHYLQ